MESEDGYEVERIADYVSFVDAYEQHFKYKDPRYAPIFEEHADFTEKKQRTICKFYFLVKWLNYTRKEITWEPEENIPPVDLATFKKINKLPTGVVAIKVLFTVAPGKPYEAPKVLSEFVTNKQRVTNESLNNMTFPLNSEEYNGKYGLVPMGEYKSKSMSKEPYLKHGDEMHTLKVVTLENAEKRDSAEVIEEFQKNDRSWLQILVRHRHIVAMRDSFFRTLEEGTKIEIISMYEVCQQSLREKIHHDGHVDWKKVCKDMLSALSTLHTNGIHQAISLDNIKFQSKGDYKLCNFKNFRFAQGINEKQVKSESVELAPRKYGIASRFDTTLDLYALAIVLLQCQSKKLFFRLNANSVTEIEEDIQKAMDFPKTDQEVRFFKMLLRARLHVHNGQARFRFTARSLLEDPILGEQKMRSVECFYMHQMSGHPLKQFVYYTPDDTVEEVMMRHLKLNHDTKKELSSYLMVASQDLAANRNTTVLIDNGETFADVVDLDVLRENNQLLIFPIVTLQSPDSTSPQLDVIVHYPPGLGGCPIVAKVNKIDEAEIKKLIRKKVFSDSAHGKNIDLVNQINPNRASSNDPEYTKNTYLMKLTVDGKGADIKNRFELAAEEEINQLNADFLSWRDVAGHEAKEPTDDYYDPMEGPSTMSDCEVLTVV